VNKATSPLPGPGEVFSLSEQEGLQHMAITTTVIGSYPKPPDEGQPFVVRKTLHGLERKETTEQDLANAQDELVRSIIGEQEAAGIEIVTDGHARWDDILTPFARHITGFEIGGLLRWFDNNVYYRRPVCVGPLEWGGPSSVAAFRFAQTVASRPVKAVIPGPVSFAHLSVDEHYGTHEEFVLALARVLAQEAFELEAAGARYLQIDEPGLLGAPEDLALANKALGLITDELKADETEVTLATYFGDAKRLGAEIYELPAQVFGFDLVAGPENRAIIDSLPNGKKVQAGLVDARNTKLEDLDELASDIGSLAERFGADRVRVAPSSGLEFLPREKARAKLARLAEAAQRAETNGR
jgi:5-methyltetrahydropteroyltriglutamate--homocysteine methyltransferase